MKWFVKSVAGAAMLVAAGAVLAAVGAVWLYLALRYGSLSGAPSGRSMIVDRALEQARNRRRAADTKTPPSAPEAQD